MDKNTCEYFYHATFHELKIKETYLLQPRVHNPLYEWRSLVNTYHDLVPNGVWFCATVQNPIPQPLLSQYNVIPPPVLPSFSPYGNRRVKIPIANLVQQLGGDVKLYAGVIDKKGPKNPNILYTRLMLVKGDAAFPILQSMTKLNISNNTLLTLGSPSQVARQPRWVEIYVPYEIDVRNCEWDDVSYLYGP